MSYFKYPSVCLSSIAVFIDFKYGNITCYNHSLFEYILHIDLMIANN